jgi:hypothetical protein
MTYWIIMNSLRTTWLAIAIALLVAGCKDAPGADGRYAHGNYYRAGDGRWAP